MTTSSYFKKALFYDQTSAINEYFEKKADQLFEDAETRSYFGFYVHRPSHRAPDDSGVHHDELTHMWNWGSDLGYDSESESPSRTEQHQSADAPPPYTRAPAERWRIDRFRISNVQQLRRHAAISEHCFRMCFLYQRHSFSRLNLTASMFNALMLEFRIFPRFKDFVLLFGSKHSENEIGVPRLRFRQLLLPAAQPLEHNCAGFECAYGLKYVELNNRSGRTPWSTRQTAVYHKFSYGQEANSSTWVFVAIPKRTKLSLGRYSEMLIVASPDEKDRLPLLDMEERQFFKDFEDSLLDNLLILDSTSDTIASLLKNYEIYCHTCKASVQDVNVNDLDLIKVALQEQIVEISSSRRKIETLHRKVQGSIQLLSSLLDLGNGNSLKTLAEEARQENTTMRKLTEKSTQDAAAVKVLTMITLVYLPATVVSNFFSTQFVGQEQEAGGSNKVVVSSNAWLFAAVSVPLTIATLVVWWLWVKLQAYQGGVELQAYQSGVELQAYQGGVDRRRGSLWRTILSRYPRRYRAKKILGSP